MGIYHAFKTQAAGFGDGFFNYFSDSSMLSSTAAVVLAIAVLVFLILAVAVVAYWAYMAAGRRGAGRHPRHEEPGRRVSAREKAEERWRGQGRPPYLRDVSKTS